MSDTPHNPWLSEASKADLENLYRAFLGREAEAEVLTRGQSRPMRELANEMAQSDDCRSMLAALGQGKTPLHQHLIPVARQEFSQWLTTRLGQPVAVDTPPEAVLAPAALLTRLFADPFVAELLLRSHGALFLEAQTQLAEALRVGVHRFAGKIEFANQAYISGWLTDEFQPVSGMQIEVRAEGRLVGTGQALGYRPDIHARLGGDGLVGFRVHWNPQLLPQGRIHLTLHAAATGTRVGPPYPFDNHFEAQLSVAQLLSKELAAIHERLDALAAMVPQALSYSAFTLPHYDLYRQVHQIPAAPTDGAEDQVPWGVVIDASRASPTALRATMEGLWQQRHAPDAVGILVGPDEVTRDVALLAAADSGLTVFDDWAAVPAWLSKRLPGDDAWVLLLSAGDHLNAEALGWWRHGGLDDEAVLVYSDEDLLLGRGQRLPERLPRHAAPVFRAAFDPDAMLEANVVGTTFAVRVAPLLAHLVERAGAIGPEHSEHALVAARREELIWALSARGRLTHVAHCLFSRTEESDAAHDPRLLQAHCTQAELAPYLPAPWRKRAWRRVVDPLMPTHGVRHVRWRPSKPRVVISVLIPTRDRGDLLRDCVDSLRQRANAPEALDIVVADNGSTDRQTLAYLRDAEAQGRLRTLRIDEPFNWSRLNNQMAAASRGEYLLFLNNDTRMLTRNWDVVLRGLLERDDVGAVGARLVHEDMSIQHAGVMLGLDGFLGHAGAGRRVDTVDDFSRAHVSHRVSAVTGAFMACRKSVWLNDVGPFDEARLAVTCNDIEWCLRAGKRHAGAILYTPALTLVHLESRTRGFDFQSASKQTRAGIERQALYGLTEVADIDPYGVPGFSRFGPDGSLR